MPARYRKRRTARISPGSGTWPRARSAAPTSPAGTKRPRTTITSGPSGSVPSTDATFEFTASELAFFECQLDGGGFGPCASPQNHSNLALGAHTFDVRATDFTGNVDPTPATRTWTVREKTLDDLDNPTQGVDVNVDQVSGTVLVGVTGAAARAARKEPGARTTQKGVRSCR